MKENYMTVSFSSNMSSRRHILAAGILALALAAIPTSSGVSITWGTPQQITGDSDVSLNGTLVGAINLAGPATTVNGVNFQALAIVNNGANTIGNFTYEASFFYNVINPALSTASASPPFSLLSAGYQSLLGTAAAAGGVQTLTMNGLTVGQAYEFQAWVNDSEDFDPFPGFTFTVNVASGNDVDLDPNTSLNDGGLGQYVIGTFVADAPSQQVTFANSEVGVANGFQLRQLNLRTPSVPDAGATLPLLAASLAGLAVVGRRAKAAARS